MASSSINVSLAAGPAPGAEEIGRSWFGAVQTGFHDFNGFEQSAEALNLGLLRWPGGTLSETRPEVYGLDHYGLFDATDLWRHDPNRDRPDLAHSMDYAIDHDMAFSMIVPTARYAGNAAEGEAHLRAFLGDLFTGEYGALPREFTLELGNEYKDLPEFENNPEVYGAVASRFAEIIAEEMDLYLTPSEQQGIDIAVQMGLTEDDNDAILGAFSTEALAATNSLVFHSLPISLRNLGRTAGDGMNRFERFETFADDWRAAIAGAGGDADPDLFMSAWTVGASTHDASQLDLQWHEYGSRGSSVAVDSVAGYSSMGVDSAAIWGIDVSNLNTVTTTENGLLELSHTGEIFRMMSDSLVGKTYMGDFTPSSRGDAVMAHHFTDGTEITSYVGINELTSFNDTVLVEYDGASNIQLVHAEMLSTELDPAFTGDWRDLEARLHEIPVVWEMEDIFTEDGLLIDFTHDYEMAEIEVVFGQGLDGSAGRDWIRGDAQSNTVQGFGGDDYLVGDKGFDTLIGGQGEDVLSGGQGNDRLFGNGGDDRLMGGAGDDVLTGGAGHDSYEGGYGLDTFQFAGGAEGGVIEDFRLGTDHIDLEDVLSGAGEVRLSGPSLQDRVANQAAAGGEVWELHLTQVGADTRLNVIDGQGGDAMEIVVRGVSAADLGANLHGAIDLGAGYGLFTPPTTPHPDPGMAATGGIGFFDNFVSTGGGGAVKTAAARQAGEAPDYLMEASDLGLVADAESDPMVPVAKADLFAEADADPQAVEFLPSKESQIEIALAM